MAVGGVDAHAAVPAAGICRPGELLAIVGTSTCHMLLGDRALPVPGICGCVEDGILPGLFGYEAGQPCVGDSFAWYLENCLPASVREEAGRAGQGLHAFLRGRAARLRPGQRGLIALDWWNGNRSVLNDADLSGLLLGMTLRTRPEEIYRAMLEATAYGARMIVETYRAHGLPVNRFVASGGIPKKDPLMMQIYADVLNMPVYVAESTQGAALGSAICGAVAAGEKRGGFASMEEAVQSLGRQCPEPYLPDAHSAAVYDRLFSVYRSLHDLFGRGGNDAMKRLLALQREAAADAPAE